MQVFLAETLSCTSLLQNLSQTSSIESTFGLSTLNKVAIRSRLRWPDSMNPVSKELGTVNFAAGSPWEDGDVESCNRTLRDEFLARGDMLYASQARNLIERWRISSLGAGGSEDDNG